MKDISITVNRTLNQEATLQLEIPDNSDWDDVEKIATEYVLSNTIDWDDTSEEGSREFNADCEYSEKLYDEMDI